MDSRSKPLGCRRRINWPAPTVEDDDEFVTSKASEKISFANSPFESFRDLPQ
jgi:hypothetical protein